MQIPVQIAQDHSESHTTLELYRFRGRQNQASQTRCDKYKTHSLRAVKGEGQFAQALRVGIDGTKKYSPPLEVTKNGLLAPGAGATPPGVTLANPSTSTLSSVLSTERSAR